MASKRGAAHVAAPEPTVSEIDAGPTIVHARSSFLHGPAPINRGPLTRAPLDQEFNGDEGRNQVIRKRSSVSSDAGLYEPIGEPCIGTLERVAQQLPGRGENLYSGIDDDVCSFYSFQSSQRSTSPSSKDCSGTLASNIYDPVSEMIAGDTAASGATNGAAPRRFVVLKSKKNDADSNAKSPPQRPSRPDGVKGMASTKSLNSLHEPRPTSRLDKGRPSAATPLTEVARVKVLAALQAPSARLTNLFAKIPRRSKSLDPAVDSRVDVASRTERQQRRRPPLLKQKSLDDHLSCASEGKKLSVRLMEMLRLDRWPRGAANSTPNVSTPSSPGARAARRDDPLFEKEPQRRLVVAGTGESFVAHLEREIVVKQISAPPTPSMGGPVVSAAVFGGAGGDSSIKMASPNIGAASPRGKASGASLPTGVKKPKALSPKERPKVPPPKTPTSPSTHSPFRFAAKSAAASPPGESFKSNASSTSSAASPSPSVPNATSAATSSSNDAAAAASRKPFIPKKPNLGPMPPPRKASREAKFASTDSSVCSGSSNESEASPPPPPLQPQPQPPTINNKSLCSSDDFLSDDYLEPINGGALYSISEPLFDSSKPKNKSGADRVWVKDVSNRVWDKVAPNQGRDPAAAPKPYPRRRSLKKWRENVDSQERKMREEEKKREEEERNQKSREKIPFDQKENGEIHIEILSNVEATTKTTTTTLFTNGVHDDEPTSFYERSLSLSPSETSAPEYFTLCKEEESRSSSSILDERLQRVVENTLRSVVAKAASILRPKERGQWRGSIRDWDILSHIPFTFGDETRRFSVYAASLKADPAEAFSLVVLPENARYDEDGISDFRFCSHNEILPRFQPQVFFPIVGVFQVDDDDDEDNVFPREFVGRKVLISPLALENLQTLDSFLTEKTLEDLATEASSDRGTDSSRASLLLQLLEAAIAFAQHRKCLSRKRSSSSSRSPPLVFSVSRIKSILVYVASKDSLVDPLLFLNPCDFVVVNDDDDDDDDDESKSILNFSSLILGDRLNSSFASVEEFLHRSRRRPRLDSRLCGALQRLGAELDPRAFLSSAAALLRLATLQGLGADVGEDPDLEESFRKFVGFCQLEEALVLEKMIHLMLNSIDESEAKTLNFDGKMALASLAKKAQVLLRIGGGHRDSDVATEFPKFLSILR